MNIFNKFIMFIDVLIIFTGCAIILKNPVIVHNDNAPGDIYFHKEFEETDTKEQTSRKQTEVTSNIKKRIGGVDDIQEVNDDLKAFDKQKDAQLKKVEQALETDSGNSPKAKIEMMRVRLIDAKIRRKLCKNNYLTIESDSLSSMQDIQESKECWENSEEQVVKLIAEIRALKDISKGE